MLRDGHELHLYQRPTFALIAQAVILLAHGQTDTISQIQLKSTSAPADIDRNIVKHCDTYYTETFLL